MRIDISAPNRKTFWATAEAIGLGRIATDQEGSEYLSTTRFIDIHDNAGAGQTIVITPAVYDEIDNLIAPAEYSPNYHVTLVVNTIEVDRVQKMLEPWLALSKGLLENDGVVGLTHRTVTLLQNIRTPQHGVADQSKGK